MIDKLLARGEAEDHAAVRKSPEYKDFAKLLKNVMGAPPVERQRRDRARSAEQELPDGQPR